MRHRSTENLGELSQLLKREGLVRTDMHCHQCVSDGNPPNFIATIDHAVDGNHQIECPRCGHIHYRVVRDGVVTEERHNSDMKTHVVERRHVWKSETDPIVASTASAFMRDLWLNRT